MDLIAGFDAKEYHGGYVQDFFAPIGLGVAVASYENFKTEYVRVWRDVLADNGLEQKRLVFSARDLALLYPLKKDRIQEEFLNGIKNQLVETNFFFTILQKERVIYSRGWYKALPAHEFMRKSMLSYTYWCAWKQMQQWRKTGTNFSSLIDDFAGEETISWHQLAKSKPVIYYRGDMSNPLIATSDVLLDLLDHQLRNQRLRDANIERQLKTLGLVGAKQYIGVPDFHNITPISVNQINKSPFRAKPTYYLLFEDRPTLLDKGEWAEAKLYNGVMDFAIKQAFENNGCIKFYDHASDSKFLSSTDCFIWYGEKGKQIVDAIGKANGVKDIYYNGQTGLF